MSIIPFELESYIIDYLDDVSKVMMKLTCTKYDNIIPKNINYDIYYYYFHDTTQKSIKSGIIHISNKAILYGYLDALLFYVKVNNEWRDDTMIYVHRSGHMNIIKYIKTLRLRNV